MYEKCKFTQHLNPFISGFTYNEQCRNNFTQMMDQCAEQHLGTHVVFHKENDLVVDGKRSGLRRACR